MIVQIVAFCKIIIINYQDSLQARGENLVLSKTSRRFLPTGQLQDGCNKFKNARKWLVLNFQKNSAI